LTVRFGYSAARAPLAYIRDNASVLRVISTAATTYAQTTGASNDQCVSANVSAADFTIASGSTGPVMTVATKRDHLVKGNGVATHIALTRASATALLLLTNCSAQTLASGHFVDIASWTATNEQAGELLPESAGEFDPPAGAITPGAANQSALLAAIAACPSGGTVYLGANTYTMTATIGIDKPMTLLGNGAGTSTGPGTSRIVQTAGLDAIYIVGTNNVHIKGIDLAANNTGAGVIISNSSFIYTEWCTIHNLRNSGVLGFADSNADIYVTDCRFYDTQRLGGAGKAAIQTVGTDNGVGQNGNTRWNILRNIISNSAQPTGPLTDEVGIGLDQVTNAVIDGNSVTQSGFFIGPPWGGEGITVVGWGNRIINNMVRGNNAGGISLLSYVGSGTVSAVTVSGNNIKGNGGTNPQGVAIVKWTGGDIRNVVIENNTVSGNAWGIQTYDVGFGAPNGGGTIVVRNNDLRGNTQGGFNFIPGSGVSASNNLT
jgi:hypothetical protein